MYPNAPNLRYTGPGVGPNPVRGIIVNGQPVITSTGGTVAGALIQASQGPAQLVNNVNTLINTDAKYIQAWGKENGPLVIIAIILIVVMLIAAKEFIM